jgi:hypothetical protein
MRQETHIRIAKALFRKLNLPREYEEIFLEAIIEPDNWRLRNPSFKHHYFQYNIVLDKIKKARRAYINGDISTSLKCLGIALHFIQDAFIPSPRTKRLRAIHDRLERNLEFLIRKASYLVNDAINEGFNVNIPSPPNFIKKCLSEVQWIYDDELKLLKVAAKTSAMITATVLGQKTPPNGLREKYILLKKNHDKRVLKASIISLISIITGLALMIFLNILAFSLLLFIVFFIVVPALSYGKIVASDKEFYEVKEEAAWYGIE